MKRLVSTSLFTYWILIDLSLGQSISGFIYVWDFTTQDRLQNLLTSKFTRDFEAALIRSGCCKVIERRNFDRVKSHRDNEKGIADLTHIQNSILDSLKTEQAEFVVFGEVFNDKDSGQFNVTVMIQSLLDGSKLLQENILMSRGKVYDAESRQEAMNSLVKKIKFKETKESTIQILPEIEQPFLKFTSRIAASISETQQIFVGNFLFEDTGLISAYSATIRDELETALSMATNLKVVPRRRIAELESQSILTKHNGQWIPGSAASLAQKAGLDGMIHGRYRVKPSTGVVIFADVEWFQSQLTEKVKIEIPWKEIESAIFPNIPPEKSALISQYVQPVNMTSSINNLTSVTKQFADVPRDFVISVHVSDGRTLFREGEEIRYKVSSTRDCYIAIFCHQVDRKTVILFPNSYTMNTWLAKDSSIEIPGTEEDGFKIVASQPFGNDIVQVIACTVESALNKLVRSYTADNEHVSGYRVIPRGQVVQAVNDSISVKGFEESKALWAYQQVIVSTIPRN